MRTNVFLNVEGKRCPVGLSRITINAILEEVDDSLSQWRQLAGNCGVRKPPVLKPIR